MSSEYRPLWDDETKEGYIPLPGIAYLRLTVWRESDKAGLVRLCNDPRVGIYSYRRPYPYTLSDADWYFDNIRKPFNLPAEATLKAYIDRADPTSSSRPPSTGFPFGALRYRANTTANLPFEDGDFVGNFHLFPYARQGILPEEMMLLPAEEQVWEIAYDILPELFGRGVGKGMIKAGLGFARWKGIGKVMAHVQEDNPASGAALRSCGFKKSYTETWDWPEEKGGGKRDVACWECSLL